MQQPHRVLVVEDEFLIAMHIQRTLEEAGATGVEVHTTSGSTLLDSLATGAFDLAVIEGRLGAPEMVRLNRELSDSGIPVVVVSADRNIAALFPGAEFLEKPFGESQLLAACAAAAERTPRPAG
jgi:DNA-binding response OmpR family regulator